MNAAQEVDYLLNLICKKANCFSEEKTHLFISLDFDNIVQCLENAILSEQTVCDLKCFVYIIYFITYCISKSELNENTFLFSALL